MSIRQETTNTIMDNDGFEKVVLKKKKNRYNKSVVLQDEIISEKLFKKYRDAVTQSRVFQDLTEQITLNKCEFNRIRCLALGSFFEEIQPLYQLSLLFELGLWKTKKTRENSDDYTLDISLYDPVFTKDDIAFINNNLNNKSEEISWKYEKESEWEKKLVDDTFNSSVLYYIPHGDMLLLEYLIPLCKPKFYLGNYIFDHLLRVENSNGNLKYLANIKMQCYETGKMVKNELKDSDSFEAVSSSSKRKNKSKYVTKNNEPQALDKIDLYFSDIQVLTKTHTAVEDGPWLSAFSSLALHEFIS